jgi:hypothetical protein
MIIDNETLFFYCAVNNKNKPEKPVVCGHA